MKLDLNPTVSNVAAFGATSSHSFQLKQKLSKAVRANRHNMNIDQYQPQRDRSGTTSQASAGLLANTFGGKVHTESDEKRLSQCLEAAENISAYKKYRDYGNDIQGTLGARVLDVGCGIGDTCRKLAERVGPRGKIFGVDTSISRLKTAERLTVQNRNLEAAANIKWVHGTADKLPFADRTFEGVRIERVLQHVEKPSAVLGEIARVLTPGGSLISVDPEWKDFTIGSNFTNPEVTRSILEFWKKSFACGEITERMPEWLSQTGFQLVEEKTFWLDYDNSFYLAEILFDLERLAPAATEAGVVAGRDAEAWLNSLRDADRAGHLKWALPLKLFHAQR